MCFDGSVLCELKEQNANFADGESESFRNLKATNYKKEPGQGQTNTPILAS